MRNSASKTDTENRHAQSSGGLLLTLGIDYISIAFQEERRKTMPIFATTFRDRFVIDADLGKNGKGTIPTGRVELERIPNPLVDSGEPWLVLKGTRVGYPESWWRSWPSGRAKTPANFQIEIEES